MIETKEVYISGKSYNEVKDIIEKLRKEYKHVTSSIGRFVGTAEYYGTIYYSNEVI